MGKAFLVLLWLFVLSAFADASPIDATGETLPEAQAAVSRAATASDQASAWVNVAQKDLDNASKALAKKPKSAAAKKTVAAARKELDSATAYKLKMDAALREELLEKSAIAKTAAGNAANAANKVTVYAEDKYQPFVDEYESAERVDPYFFFGDPIDYKNKAVILDAKFDEIISPGVAQFTIWRNFGKMHVIVSNVPTGFAIPKDKSMLLAGVITGFDKEVVSGELLVITLLKLNGVFICSNSRCRD